jgi:hypothetical protein
MVNAIADRFAAAELSWATITPAQLRAKIADIEEIRVMAIRESCRRMLAHAVASHAPHHRGLLPPEWIAP